MATFGTVGTAMATPLDDDESLDLLGAARLARHLVDHGTDLLVLNGTTGESPTLGRDEVALLVTAVRDAVGTDAQIIVGTGTNATRATIERTKAAAELGVDGVLVVSPYYNRPDHAGMMRHFTEVAAATDLPMMVYDVPSRTGRAMEVRTLVELSTVDTIMGVKDAAADLGKTADVLRQTASAATGFDAWCGADEVNLPMLSLGAVGLVSVTAHLAGDDLARMCAAVRSGDLATARGIHLRLMPLHRALFAAPSPAPLKAGLGLLDLPAGPVRGPLVDAPDDIVELVRDAMDHAGLLPHLPNDTDSRNG